MRNLIVLLSVCILGIGCATTSAVTSPYQRAVQATQNGPLSVVALFAALDTSGVWRGRGLDPSADSARARLICWRPDEQCTTDEPGWDTHYVVAGYEIRVIFESSDSAHVDVLYDKRAAWYVNAYVRSAEPFLWTVTLKRLADGWRIVSPESQRPSLISQAQALRLAGESSAQRHAILDSLP